MSPKLSRGAMIGTACLRAVPLVLFLGLAAVQPARAEGAPRPGGGGLGSVLDETTGTMLRLFQTFIRTIPQFEAPEVLPNGDIIIRRKPPATSSEPGKAEPGEDETLQL
jgi:hypothetical protein